jgi:hypothetical protein
MCWFLAFKELFFTIQHKTLKMYTKEIIQIENITVEEFKKEIIEGVVARIIELGLFNNTKTENPNELLSRADTSKILNISLVKLWEITKQKMLPVYKVGGKVLYKREDINVFITTSIKS